MPLNNDVKTETKVEKPDKIIGSGKGKGKKGKKGKKGLSDTPRPKESNEITLKNIDLQIKEGEFVCIVGDVASGKSSLLQAMLGDMVYITNEDEAALKKAESNE
jgi:ABC-type polysaccharide/polyol phosphate transport system ATPase subunit